MRTTIIINILVLTIILISVNIFSYFFIQIYYAKQEQKSFVLPAMTNENYAKIRKEFNQLETEYQPFIAWKTRPINKKYTKVNKDGDRVTIQKKQKTGKVIRFFGGSTMWGTGVEDSNTLPSCFERCKDDSRIINHGERGFNSRQSLELFTNLLIKNKSVDIAVFYDGVNDIADFCFEKLSIPGHGREVQMREKLTTVKSTRSYFRGKDGIFNLSLNLLSKIFIANTQKLVHKIIGKFFKKNLADPYSCHTNQGRADAVANHLLNTWKIAHQIATANDIEFIAILQPNLFVGKVKNDYLNLEKRGSLGENFQVVYPILKEKIKAYDWIYDFTEIFDKNENPVYFDFCHINQEGNEIVANQICEIVNRIKKEK